MINNNILVDSHTIAHPLQTEVYDIFPSEKGGILLNGIESSINNVIYSFDRIDLATNINRVFLVEHAIALCALFGIHNACIKGTQREWDLNRPSHFDARSFNKLPSDVFGESTGKICAKKFKERLKLIATSIKTNYNIIDREYRFKDNMGTEVILLPPSYLPKLTIVCSAKAQHINIEFNLNNGIEDINIINEILNSRSIAALKEWNREVISHAVGDIIADIIWMGKIAADIIVKLGQYYHRATISAVKQIMN